LSGPLVLVSINFYILLSAVVLVGISRMTGVLSKLPFYPKKYPCFQYTVITWCWYPINFSRYSAWNFYANV